MSNVDGTRNNFTGKARRMFIMEIDQLRNFLAVSQLGSFQKVADQRFISQRTVSKQMTNIENELGVQLFFRTSNKITLTDAGKYFSQKASDLINQLDDSILKLHDITDKNLQTLRIGYFSPFESSLLVQHLRSYQTNQSENPIRFYISEASIEHLIADVTLGILDCAYILDYGTHEHLMNSDLSHDIITQGEMVVGMSEHHPLRQKKILNATDLINQRILYYSNESSTYLQSAFLATLPSHYQYLVQRVSTIEQMQALVSLGQAIAFYPSNLPLLFDHNIIFRQLKNPANPQAQEYTIRLIYRSDNNINGLQLFRQYLMHNSTGKKPL